MSSISSPYGIQPISSQEGFSRPIRMPNGIASGQVGNIFKYQAVTINPVTGTLVPVTNPGGVPQRIFGIFMGAEFAPLGGRPQEFNFWASGTVWDPTLDMFVYVAPMWQPGTRWKIQADGAVAQALMGAQFNITNVAAGNTTTGMSACTVGAAGVAAGAQGQFALVEFFPDINTVIGDAFTDLVFTCAFPQVGLGSQTSIG